MKNILIVISLLFLSAAVFADTWVNGYTRKNGTYVQGHYRSSGNSTKLDNYSTRGNTNPYTGQKGYKNPYNTNSYSNGYGQKKKKKKSTGYYGY